MLCNTTCLAHGFFHHNVASTSSGPSQILLLQSQDSHEGILRDLHSAQGLHPLLALSLFTHKDTNAEQRRKLMDIVYLIVYYAIQNVSTCTRTHACGHRHADDALHIIVYFVGLPIAPGYWAPENKSAAWQMQWRTWTGPTGWTIIIILGFGFNSKRYALQRGAQ